VDSTGFHLNICINLAEKNPIFKWIQVGARSNFLLWNIPPGFHVIHSGLFSSGFQRIQVDSSGLK